MYMYKSAAAHGEYRLFTITPTKNHLNIGNHIGSVRCNMGLPQCINIQKRGKNEKRTQSGYLSSAMISIEMNWCIQFKLVFGFTFVFNGIIFGHDFKDFSQFQSIHKCNLFGLNNNFTWNRRDFSNPSISIELTFFSLIICHFSLFSEEKKWFC